MQLDCSTYANLALVRFDYPVLDLCIGWDETGSFETSNATEGCIDGRRRARLRSGWLRSRVLYRPEGHSDTDIKQTEVDCYEDSGKTWQAHF